MNANGKLDALDLARAALAEHRPASAYWQSPQGIVDKQVLAEHAARYREEWEHEQEIKEPSPYDGDDDDGGYADSYDDMSDAYGDDDIGLGDDDDAWLQGE